MTENPSYLDSIGFELQGSDLGPDVESALEAALTSGAVFIDKDPLAIFQHALAASIRNIETHPKGKLFQDFLLKGPYEETGRIPKKMLGQRLSDDETATAIKFIYSHMVNCFKGAITELLASAACLRLMRQLQDGGELPAKARLYVGDTVLVHRKSGRGVLKGADFHILNEASSSKGRCLEIVGVAEVKSGYKARSDMHKQLVRNITRAKQGLRVSDRDFKRSEIRSGSRSNRRIILITVQPSDWKLPRKYWFEQKDDTRLLQMEPAAPQTNDDQITKLDRNHWHISLKWSKEALAAAAYEMTFWYMEKIGEVIYSDEARMPREWDGMSRAEAGRNAAKMMLYYAIPRCRTKQEWDRAVAIYNCYGFGYALGMNFRDKNGRREMLWPEDLDEILASGETKHGCYIA